MKSFISLALLLLHCGAAVARPFVPADDAQVLERLPFRRADPSAAALAALRRAAADAPADAAAAERLARKYFELASAEGDPRYIGYAEAAIRRWPGADAPVGIVLVRALLRQYRHEFDTALAELAQVIARDPTNQEAMFWRAALYLVKGDYPAARAECARMDAVATRLTVLACASAVDSVTGGARAAHAALSRLMEREPPRGLDFRIWIVTRMAEMAQRFGDDKLAERHFREAIRLTGKAGSPDGFVLAALADLLLDLGRPREVVELLRDWTRSDVLMVRLAIAEAAAGAPDAARHAQELRERFAASALRGDRLHMQEEARVALALDRDPKRALRLAQENWATQHEPRDARALMEAALAAGEPAAAKGALDWMRATGYEEPRYRALAARLDPGGNWGGGNPVGVNPGSGNPGGGK